MRIRVVSDLHLDIFPDRGADRLNKVARDASTIDVLVVAGDLCEVETGPDGDLGLYGRSLLYLRERFASVVVVAGNHEFYGTSFPAVFAHMRELQLRWSNVHFLDLVDSVRIAGRTFTGGTLWFAEKPDPFGHHQRMNDFSNIQDLRKYAYGLGLTTKAKIVRNCEKDTIVVTHHAPSIRSASPGLLRDPLTELFYVNDCTQIICEQKPALWIHGHMHKPVNYVHPASSTLVLSNPLGYPSQTGGKPNHTLEVP
jgi:DNA repair exonuclease SbcCD nuclease subunit